MVVFDMIRKTVLHQYRNALAFLWCMVRARAKIIVLFLLLLFADIFVAFLESRLAGRCSAERALVSTKIAARENGNVFLREPLGTENHTPACIPSNTHVIPSPIASGGIFIYAYSCIMVMKSGCYLFSFRVVPKLG